MKNNWDEEEEKLKKARKRKKDKKMRVSGKGVFTLKEEMEKKDKQKK